MPVLNAAATLGQAVASVQAQSFSDWELMIVDNGSTDGSRTLAEALAAGDGRIRALSLDGKRGAAAARNHGLAAARGRYVAFLDADDLWLPQKLDRQIAFMRQSGAAISFTGYARVDPAGRLIEEVAAPSTLRYPDLLRRNEMGCLTVVYDSEQLGRREMPTFARQHDYALWLRLVRQAGGARGLNVRLAVYRVGRGTLSANKLAALADMCRVYRGEGLGMASRLWYIAHYIRYGLAHRLIQRPPEDAPVVAPAVPTAMPGGPSEAP